VNQVSVESQLVSSRSHSTGQFLASICAGGGEGGRRRRKSKLKKPTLRILSSLTAPDCAVLQHSLVTHIDYSKKERQTVYL
jgi:hypothetical protein